MLPDQRPLNGRCCCCCLSYNILLRLFCTSRCAPGGKWPLSLLYLRHYTYPRACNCSFCFPSFRGCVTWNSDKWMNFNSIGLYSTDQTLRYIQDSRAQIFPGIVESHNLLKSQDYDSLKCALLMDFLTYFLAALVSYSTNISFSETQFHLHL